MTVEEIIEEVEDYEPYDKSRRLQEWLEDHISVDKKEVLHLIIESTREEERKAIVEELDNRAMSTYSDRDCELYEELANEIEEGEI